MVDIEKSFQWHTIYAGRGPPDQTGPQVHAGHWCHWDSPARNNQVAGRVYRDICTGFGLEDPNMK